MLAGLLSVARRSCGAGEEFVALMWKVGASCVVEDDAAHSPASGTPPIGSQGSDQVPPTLPDSLTPTQWSPTNLFPGAPILEMKWRKKRRLRLRVAKIISFEIHSSRASSTPTY